MPSGQMAMPCRRSQWPWLLSATTAVVWSMILLVVFPVATAQPTTSAGRFQFGQAEYMTTTEFGVALVTVQRHLGSDGRAAVYVSTLPLGGGNAVAGRDFRAVFNQSLLWQDGDDLDKEIYIRVLDDAMPQETSKSFTLYLHDATGAALNSERNTTQIVLQPPSNLVSGSFRLLQSTVVTTESSTALLEIPVVWEGGTTSTARLAYFVECESACNPDDFEIQSPAILKWTRGGNTTQFIQIQIKDDGQYEPSESFRIRLLPPRDLEAAPLDPQNDPSSVFTLPPATLGNITQIQIWIQGPNNMNSGVVQFEAPCFPACVSHSYIVRDGGLVRAYLQRRNGTDGAVRVRVISVDGSAHSGVDYKPVDQLIQWEEGDLATQFVLVEMIGGVVRTQDARFALKLISESSSTATNPVAETVTITIQGPSNQVPNEVNFVVPNPLKPVLRHPDTSFFPFATRLDSGIRACPRLVVHTAGTVTLHLQRFFGNSLAHKPATVVVKTSDVTATDGVDYIALPAHGQQVVWTGEEAQASSVKTIDLTILEPASYYTERRSFFVEITAVTDVALGLCHIVEVVLDRVARAPHITGFDLDLDQGSLTLRTSVPVFTASLDASALTLFSDMATGTTLKSEVFQLSQPSVTTATGGSDGTATVVVLTLAASDLNALKRFPRLAKSPQTTYLSATTGAFAYELENCLSQGLTACAHAPLEALPRTSPLAVTALTADTTRPVLLSYTMDMGLQLVKLRFSEPVDSSSTRIESLGFSDTERGIEMFHLSSASSHVFRPNPNPLSGVLLLDGNPLPQDATYVSIHLGSTDIAGIRAVGNGQIGVLATTTFLTMEAEFVRDFAAGSPNSVVAIESSVALGTMLLQVASADCSPCPTATYLASSCSDMKDRVCKPCSVCPSNSYALVACMPLEDTVCYPCTECIGGRYTASECSATSDRVCASCTLCTKDEFEFAPCVNQQDRICRTCDSCTLSKAQQRLCNGSKRWKRLQMKSPYGCPTPDQQFQTLESRLQRAKSNRCGAGRCSCTGNLAGNANPNGDSFPNDPRCTGPEVYGIDL